MSEQGTESSTDLSTPPPVSGAVPRLRAFNQVAAFQYVTAPLAPTYRAIVQAFFDAKQRYIIELRPRDVLRLVQEAGYHVEATDEDELDAKLTQLVEWGNLTRSHDTHAVATIRDFYRRRYVYHLTPVGESAHRAVLDVEATIGKSGSLQATMLAKIRDALESLASAASAEEPDPDRALGLLHDLHAAFETLTLEANRFIGDLNRHAQGEQIDEERFALRKQALLAYISRFVEELRRLRGEITAGIEAVTQAGIDGLLRCASESKDLPPDLGDGLTKPRWIERERDRWDGVASWFVGDAGGAVPTVERLAQVAVSAVVSLTRTLGRLNDRRGQAVDRAADFRTLARWFSACGTDLEAHQLWKAAFGLYPSRHFHIEDEDEELTGSRVSWWDAAPASVPVTMRSRGRVSHGGRAAAVPDYSDQRRWIAQLRRREREQLEAAVDRFAERRTLRLSDIAELDEAEFDLLLSLLDEALVAPRSDDGSHSTRTSDGRLRIVLRRPRRDDSAEVTLRTPRGLLRCRNYLVEVRRTTRAAGGAHGVAG